jgi:hypothetical protein
MAPPPSHSQFLLPRSDIPCANGGRTTRIARLSEGGGVRRRRKNGKDEIQGRRAMNACSRSARPAKANLNEIHIFGLQALRPFLYFKRHARALVERAVSAGRNG